MYKKSKIVYYYNSRKKHPQCTRGNIPAKAKTAMENKPFTKKRIFTNRAKIFVKAGKRNGFTALKNGVASIV